jgi:lysophospholipase L1-like esterase
VTLGFLALGDSYTIGEGVDPTERWPVQLATLLRARGIDLVDPEIIATTGWTTDELAAGIDAAGPNGQYDLVSLLIGVNNQYRSRPIEEYREQFRALLHRAIAFAGEKPDRVIVLSIPDWGVTPFARAHDRERIGAEIERFNAVNREETMAVHAHYIDVTGVSREAAANPALVAADGLHPSARMYARWASLALQPALAALQHHET